MRIAGATDFDWGDVLRICGKNGLVEGQRIAAGWLDMHQEALLLAKE